MSQVTRSLRTSWEDPVPSFPVETRAGEKLVFQAFAESFTAEAPGQSHRLVGHLVTASEVQSRMG